jgi:predicted NBD/HSP70 family sugar kinase
MQVGPCVVDSPGPRVARRATFIRHDDEMAAVSPDSSLRAHNRTRVLTAFSGVAALSRSEICERTGLSRTTVSAIVAELLADSTLHTVSFPARAGVPSGAGRRPTFLALARPRGYGIGVDIGHEYVQVAIADLAGRVLAHQVSPLDATAGAPAAVARVAEMVDALLYRARLERPHCTGVVAAVPEPVGRDGEVSRPGFRSRWRGKRPGALVTEALGIATHAENDVNLAVVGETVFGTSRGMQDVIYVKLAHGVGSGIIANGRLVRGGAGLAGEIGHTQVRSDGAVCTCGNRGCLYTLVTPQYLAQLLPGVNGDPRLGIEDLAEMGRCGHPGAARVLTDAGREVGRAVGNLCNTLNPSRVIVGGSLARAGAWVLTGVRESMDRYAEPHVAETLAVTTGGLGERAEILGALAMAVGIVDPASGVAPAGPLTAAEERPAGAANARPTRG